MDQLPSTDYQFINPWIKRWRMVEQFKNNISIVVNTAKGAIENVIQRGSIVAQVKPGDIDLRRKIAMPGFISERSSTEQMRDKSIVERTLRAVNHMRLALLSGYTTYRDLGTEANRSAIHAMAENGCIYVPTLAVVEAVAKERLPEAQAIAREAHAIGVRLAVGGDTGAFNHGQGAREMELLVEAGIPVEDVLEACMLGGWESCGRHACGYRFGWLEKGNRADIIALDTDPRIDKKAFRKVSFVMKDAHVWKQNSIPVGFIDRIMDKAAQSDSVWELV
ncbi:hypothetical protein ARSEF4850_004082 [Beauveria asiatica]